MVHFMFIAPMHSYVSNVLVYKLHIAIFSRVSRMLLVCTCVTRMLLVCTRVYSYVTRIYSYVTRMLLVVVCSFSHDQQNDVISRGFYVVAGRFSDNQIAQAVRNDRISSECRTGA